MASLISACVPKMKGVALDWAFGPAPSPNPSAPGDALRGAGARQNCFCGEARVGEGQPFNSILEPCGSNTADFFSRADGHHPR